MYKIKKKEKFACYRLRSLGFFSGPCERRAALTVSGEVRDEVYLEPLLLRINFMH